MKKTLLLKRLINDDDVVLEKKNQKVIKLKQVRKKKNLKYDFWFLLSELLL